MYWPIPREAPVTSAVSFIEITPFSTGARTPHAINNRQRQCFIAPSIGNAYYLNVPTDETGYPKALGARVGFLLARAHLIAREKADRALATAGLNMKGFAALA